MVIDALKKSDIFSSFSDDEFEDISRYFEEADYRNNEIIFHEGDPSVRLFLVSEGSVKIIKHTVMGKDIILEVISPGDIFGGVAVLDKRPYPATAQAMATTHVISISRNRLFEIIEEYPILKLSVVKNFSDKLRDSHEMLKNIATERVEKRIASLLLKLAEKVGVDEGEFKRIDFQLTRQEISEMVGTTVETCIRTMSKFQKDDLVRSADNRIVIDTAKLRTFLEE